jgi:hypothetical protein
MIFFERQRVNFSQKTADGTRSEVVILRVTLNTYPTNECSFYLQPKQMAEPNGRNHL